MKFLGLGIDLVYIPRIKRLLEIYGERFLKRIFNSEEIEYALKKTKACEALAGAFAVKEAFYKALGGYSSFSFKDLTLLRESSIGKPILKLQGKAEEIFYKKGGKKIDLSLSHDFQYTIAIVILWGKE